jgi:hypothetical protein
MYKVVYICGEGCRREVVGLLLMIYGILKGLFTYICRGKGIYKVLGE